MVARGFRSPFAPLLLLAFLVSTNGNHPLTRSVLKAAQPDLTEGLLCLRMASSARGIRAPLGEGEFLGSGAGALSGLAGGSLLRSQFNIFFAGGG